MEETEKQAYENYKVWVKENTYTQKLFKSYNPVTFEITSQKERHFEEEKKVASW